ncbi:hypothetical protein EDC04DRAFT_1015076 [Pisolithus marmoratus]|nr:hypothetical protein EDC04DRAFT_1015076 [Pisolithus marmoratus]
MWWWMQSDHLHCHPVALGFIESEWSHGRWWWMHATHLHCHPIALGFIVCSEWSHKRDLLMLCIFDLQYLGVISWFVSLLSASTPLSWSPCYIIQIPNIQQSLYTLRMPTLSNSKEYSLQYTAEQGIGAILILEYLYFVLQVKDQRNDFQVALDLAVHVYQTSGTRDSVCKLINEAFQQHGEDVEILCPILLQVAKEKQMSRMMTRQG